VIELVIYRLSDVGGSYWPPQCRAIVRGFPCDASMELAPQPGDFALDLHTDGEGDQGFQKFSVDVDGTRVEIDSLHKLRQIERDSEQRYRNGEGEPLRFRGYTQDSSNLDVNSFGDSGEIGEGTVKRAYSAGAPLEKSGKIGIRRHGEDQPQVTLGPGMKKAASSLPG